MADDRPSTSNNQDVQKVECYNKCKETVSYKGGFCGKCSTFFCDRCLKKHDEAMNVKYSQRIYEVCRKHKSRLDLFCGASKCNVLICRKCVDTIHKHHDQDIVQCKVKSKKCLDDLLEFQQVNEDKLNEIVAEISRLENKKALFKQQSKANQKLLKDMSDTVLEYVQDLYCQQSNALFLTCENVIKEFNKQIEKLRNTQTELTNFMKVDAHFPRNEKDVKIIKLYQDRMPFTNSERKSHLVEFKTVHIVPATYMHSHIQEALECLNGEINLLINESNFTSNDEAYAISTVYETKDEIVQDVFYDSKKQDLFVLVTSDLEYEILKICQNTVENRYQFKGIDSVTIKAKIALLPNRKILFLCNKSLKLISEDSKHMDESPIVFGRLTNVAAICSSPCLTLTYVCYYEINGLWYILKYKNDIDNKDIPLNLEEEPDNMEVHDDLDHIAFIGRKLNSVYMFSLSQQRLISVICDKSASYISGCFLSDNKFVAYNSKSQNLEILDFVTEETLQRIKEVNKNGKNEIGRLHSITKCNSNTLFVCQSNDRNQQIYKMVFKLSMDESSD